MVSVGVNHNEVFMTLTNAWVASSNEHNLVREVTPLQDVKCSCIPIIAFWFYDNVFDSKCLPWVEICTSLVDVAKKSKYDI